MLRVAALGPIIIGSAILSGFSLLVLRLAFGPAVLGPSALAALLIGLASFTVTCVVFGSLNRDARQMRKRVETLLRDGRAERPFVAERDEMSALASSLEVAARQVRVVVENSQRESSRLEAILSSMVEGVVAVDPLMRITFLNRAFAEVMAVSLPIEPGIPLVQVVRDHGLLDMFTSVLSTGERAQKRLVLFGRTFEVQVAPLAGDPHRGALAMLFDITEIERLERVRKDFVANVSHELRTPLSAVCGYAETLLEGGLEDPENNRKFAEIILSKARQLTNIVTDLLILSSLESGKAPMPEPISLRSTIESALRTVEPVARNRGVRLECVTFDDIRVLAHEIRLEQVFVNLLDNAVKFNRPDGEVRIEVSRDPRHALVRVCDNGLGIPSRDLPRVFERFYRVDKARSRATGGTGLGLAIVKHAVEQMGGSVSVESRLGQGSTFTVALPPLEDNSLAN
jgi:two-component system phosphate regulon sensor histidine kinase PhoR